MPVPVTLVNEAGERLAASAWQVEMLWVIKPNNLPFCYHAEPLHQGYWLDAGWTFEPELDSYLSPPGMAKYRCSKCGNEVDFGAYRCPNSHPQF